MTIASIDAALPRRGGARSASSSSTDARRGRRRRGQERGERGEAAGELLGLLHEELRGVAGGGAALVDHLGRVAALLRELHEERGEDEREIVARRSPRSIFSSPARRQSSSRSTCGSNELDVLLAEAARRPRARLAALVGERRELARVHRRARRARRGDRGRVLHRARRTASGFRVGADRAPPRDHRLDEDGARAAERIEHDASRAGRSVDEARRGDRVHPRRVGVEAVDVGARGVLGLLARVVTPSRLFCGGVLGRRHIERAPEERGVGLVPRDVDRPADVRERAAPARGIVHGWMIVVPGGGVKTNYAVVHLRVHDRLVEVEPIVVPLAVEDEHAPHLLGLLVDVEEDLLVRGRRRLRGPEEHPSAREVHLLAVEELEIEGVAELPLAGEERRAQPGTASAVTSCSYICLFDCS